MVESVTHNDWGSASQDFESEAHGTAFVVISKEALRKEIERATARVEKQFLEALMAHCQGNVSAAAKASGIHRSHLQRMISRRLTP